ncbi:hypothetical protein BDC45DRAFT_541021 [Circinella umbellata]|nr:hypothetical protein BDC45DRAFT_541021 [Circinella umbellata]
MLKRSFPEKKLQYNDKAMTTVLHITFNEGTSQATLHVEIKKHRELMQITRQHHMSFFSVNHPCAWSFFLLVTHICTLNMESWVKEGALFGVFLQSFGFVFLPKFSRKPRNLGKYE